MAKTTQVETEDELSEALKAVAETLRLATEDIAARGAMINAKDWEGKSFKTVNPAVKVQRETTQTIISLRNLILQEQKRLAKKEKI